LGIVTASKKVHRRLLMTFEATVSLGSLLAFIGLLATAYAMWSNAKSQRANFLFEVYNGYPDGDKVDEIHAKIDSLDFAKWEDKWWYTEKDTAMASLLWYYDLIAYLLSKGILKKREAETFQHDIEALAASKGVKQYIEVIRKMDNENKVSTVRYPYLIKWIKRQNTETSVWGQQ
jgi:hypothetical protein